jgi:hypothetical protein
VSGLISGLASGGWPFLVGWVFPASLVLTLCTLLLDHSGGHLAIADAARTLSITDVTVLISFSAIALGLLLSALQTPLYRLLEGYYLSEATARRFSQRHLARRNKLKHALEQRRKELKAAKDEHPDAPGPVGSAIHTGLLLEKLRRYPSEDDQLAPTRLANSIRSFERYGVNRFFLDTQSLWSELLNVVPQSVRTDQERARAGVDFFVSLLYLSALSGVGLAAEGVLAHNGGLIVAGVTGIGTVALWYRLAVLSTNAWYESVQALVNLGRKPLAAALNLRLPVTLEEERQMWRTVGWMVREPYNPKLSELLAPYQLAAN